MKHVYYLISICLFLFNQTMLGKDDLTFDIGSVPFSCFGAYTSITEF